MDKKKYIIKDWAGNVLNYDSRFVLPQLAAAMEFESFDDAWDWLRNKFDDEEMWQEFWVDEV